jgi:hypothetical protein
MRVESKSSLSDITMITQFCEVLQETKKRCELFIFQTAEQYRYQKTQGISINWSM